MQDDIPAIIDTVMEAMHARANPVPGEEGYTTRPNTTVQGGSTQHGAGNQTRSRRQVTYDDTDSQATQMHGETAPLTLQTVLTPLHKSQRMIQTMCQHLAPTQKILWISKSASKNYVVMFCSHSHKMAEILEGCKVFLHKT